MAFLVFGVPILLTFSALFVAKHIAEKEDWEEDDDDDDWFDGEPA